MDEQRRRAPEAEADGVIEGRNAVIEALRAGEQIDKIYLQKGETDKTLGHIASRARAAGVVVVEADRRKLDAMSRTHAHQGVIALAAVREYVSVESILQAASDKGEAPLLVICDEISDPHNLGAIIRTAECAGAHGVVIPKRRSAGLTAVVAKTSAGAVAHMPVARVPNLPALLKDLKKQGLWIFGTAAQGTTTLYDADLKGPAAIIIGSEGEGMSRLVEENCDFLVSIPMRGKLNSLNASAAAAIMLYEAVRQRRGEQGQPGQGIKRREHVGQDGEKGISGLFHRRSAAAGRVFPGGNSGGIRWEPSAEDSAGCGGGNPTAGRADTAADQSPGDFPGGQAFGGTRQKGESICSRGLRNAGKSQGEKARDFLHRACR